MLEGAERFASSLTLPSVEGELRMAVLYVASDREGAGKTSLCLALARSLDGAGKSVRVVKPVAAAGLDAHADPDSDIIGNLLGQPADGWPVASGETRLNAAVLRDAAAVVAKAAEGTDVVIVEASCALSPEESARMAQAMDATAMVVVRYLRELTASDLKPLAEAFGDRFAGCVINGLTRYMGTELQARLLPSLESEGVKCLGVIPEERRLLGVTVGKLAEHLNGRLIVCREETDGLVEHLLVGMPGMDPGEFYFGIRERKAAIIRGDRPDLQFAAINADAACLVLTKGIEPIEYVRYEAEQEEVPVMVVDTDTLTTMDALNTLMDGARFDHPLKLERLAELVELHLDMRTLLSVLGGGRLAPTSLASGRLLVPTRLAKRPHGWRV